MFLSYFSEIVSMSCIFLLIIFTLFHIICIQIYLDCDIQHFIILHMLHIFYINNIFQRIIWQLSMILRMTA